jgi:hypothetical protein
MHNILYRPQSSLANLNMSIPSSDELRLLTNFNCPPSNTRLPNGAEDWLNGRTRIGISIFRQEITAGFLLCGLTKSKTEGGSEEYSFPKARSVSKEDIDEISESAMPKVSPCLIADFRHAPFQLCRKITFPPTCQIIGTEDGVFQAEHATWLATALEEQRIPHKEHVIIAADHASDIAAESGGDVHLNVMKPTVDWVSRFV